MVEKYIDTADNLSKEDKHVVIFIDEIDSLCLAGRDDGTDGGTSRRVNNLLMTKISGINHLLEFTQFQ